MGCQCIAGSKEQAMAGTMTRQEAREHVLSRMKAILDRMMPADAGMPVKDGVFREWEDMADEFDRETTAALMEALAGLSEKAKLDQPGVCPACASANVRWLDPDKQQERQSKHGVVVLPRQVARCRSCGRSFSPSGTAVATGPARASHAAGGGEGVPGGRAGAL
jgi:hypothetical protein